MKKIIQIGGAVVITLCLTALAYCVFEAEVSKRIPDTNQVIDSLSNKIDSIKIENITLIQRNDSIQVKIVEVEKTYEKNTNTILANDVSEDYAFFTNYISRYFDSNYSRTVKGD